MPCEESETMRSLLPWQSLAVLTAWCGAFHARLNKSTNSDVLSCRGGNGMRCGLAFHSQRLPVGHAMGRWLMGEAFGLPMRKQARHVKKA
jgi:hypothetical protein